MTEHLHELEDRSLSAQDVVAAVLGRLDNVVFSHPLERARIFGDMLREKGFAVLPASERTRYSIILDEVVSIGPETDARERAAVAAGIGSPLWLGRKA